ncbi:rhomboid family intramembrane serine protease [Roseisolibacter sp. H3M3-2]|uniref:rhomboid family intramembrane serine protease n=1 Tax=Roseisolibacter sp. H3M3-2 TaxID=3031323 RepID=UPI0023DAA442|nr:rhomboid family intramembrane serine protease [Roseisolibacter sp. H3M3-2]MDF1503267.1 rhomboid family intramembrane serine protease [Roseisolibacter sp. H3M3-2]
MIPISDENPTLRTPVVTYALLAALVAVWVLAQGAGATPVALIASVCNWGMVPGELTGGAPLGLGIPMGEGLACVIDAERKNVLTPLTSMFLHGGWAHLLGNCLYLWVFGNNVEDSMGRGRFLVFYLACGLAAAATHVLLEPTSPIPTVGASGAISGVLGGYLLLYPRVRVRTYFPPIFLFHVPAWLMLILWFGQQVLSGLPQLLMVRPEASGGVAVWAHVGGFVAGVALVKLFEDRSLVRRRVVAGDARVAFDPQA